MTYTINNNAEFHSVEIAFDCKPSDEIRSILKGMHFRWHSVKKVWYGYKDANAVKNALENIKSEKTVKSPKSVKKANKYGVNVGDIFSASWGWEQTNVNFFQVVALVGECSVRVREVCPEITAENPTCSMAADRTYKMTRDILPPCSHSVFIKDQEKGDLKRIKPGYHQDPEIANQNCYFYLDTFANAHKCNSDSVTCYESWYA